jgi:hypothetical protein
MLQMFQALPDHIVLCVLEHLRAHSIAEVFAAVPADYHPQVVQAFFPEVAQSQSLSLESRMFISNQMHVHQGERSSGVHQCILNAVAKLHDMRHLSLRLFRSDWASMKQLMSDGLRSMTRCSLYRSPGNESLRFLTI